MIISPERNDQGSTALGARDRPDAPPERGPSSTRPAVPSSCVWRTRQPSQRVAPFPDLPALAPSFLRSISLLDHPDGRRTLGCNRPQPRPNLRFDFNAFRTVLAHVVWVSGLRFHRTLSIRFLRDTEGSQLAGPVLSWIQFSTRTL